MDAYEIARLMANQDAQNPLAMRYGTVQSLNDDGSVSVVPDGQDQAVPAVKCCRPCVGNRVVLLVNGTEWLAVSVMGGECPYEVGDYLTTSDSANPSARWQGTEWQRIENRFLWGTLNDAKIGNTGGEQSHTLSYAEMPSHRHTAEMVGMWVMSTGWGGGFNTYGQWNTVANGGSYECYGSGVLYQSFEGGNSPHNNMPPYLECAIWHRLA